MREAGVAGSDKMRAASPAAASTTNSNKAAETAALQRTGLVCFTTEAANNSAPSNAILAAWRPPAAFQSAIGLPETSRFGAKLTKPDSATAIAPTATRTNNT